MSGGESWSSSESEGEVRARLVQQRQRREAVARRSEYQAQRRGRYVYLDEGHVGGSSSQACFSFPNQNDVIPSDPWTLFDERIVKGKGLEKLFLKDRPSGVNALALRRPRTRRRFKSLAAINAELDAAPAVAVAAQPAPAPAPVALQDQTAQGGAAIVPRALQAMEESAEADFYQGLPDLNLDDEDDDFDPALFFGDDE